MHHFQDEILPFFGARATLASDFRAVSERSIKFRACIKENAIKDNAIKEERPVLRQRGQVVLLHGEVNHNVLSPAQPEALA